MSANKIPRAALWLALIFFGAPLAAQDALDRGAALFLTGKLDEAVIFFTQAIKDNSGDSRAREILVNCLIIQGKEAVLDRQYAAGRAALEKAVELSPEKPGLKMMLLLAELDEKAPSAAISISSTSLEATAETNAVFECLFGNGACAKGEKYIFHIVVKGETMADIAIRYYNDFTQWEKIWAANPQILNPHRLEKGVRLLIPLDK